MGSLKESRLREEEDGCHRQLLCPPHLPFWPLLQCRDHLQPAFHQLWKMQSNSAFPLVLYQPLTTLSLLKQCGTFLGHCKVFKSAKESVWSKWEWGLIERCFCLSSPGQTALTYFVGLLRMCHGLECQSPVWWPAF